jgi:hypothetical protein
MISIIAASTIFDLGLVAVDVAYLRMGGLSLLLNGWGMLDAALRFPRLHELESLFTLKHLMIVILKCMSYVCGFQDMANSKIWLATVLLTNGLVLPLLYFAALPCDLPEDQIRLACHDALDEDVAVRVGRLLVDPSERLHFLGACKLRAQRLLMLKPTAKV